MKEGLVKLIDFNTAVECPRWQSSLSKLLKHNFGLTKLNQTELRRLNGLLADADYKYAYHKIYKMINVELRIIESHI